MTAESPQNVISIEELVSRETFEREFANQKKELGEQQRNLQVQQQDLHVQQRVLEELQNDLKEQKSWIKIMIGVVVGAFIFTLGSMVLDFCIFHAEADKELLHVQNQYFQEVKELREKNYQSEFRLQQEIDSLKARPSPPLPQKK